tara:strand:+ start:938 stop:1141 length:204 start_codon:yes stop_codon:yes gene_type:complete
VVTSQSIVNGGTKNETAADCPARDFDDSFKEELEWAASILVNRTETPMGTLDWCHVIVSVNEGERFD